MDEINENKIEVALLEGTDTASELKDMVWHNIEKKLDFKEDKAIIMKKSNKLKYGGIAAAFLAVVLLTNVNQVNAAVDKIRQLFEPKKTIQQSLEGMDEKTEVELAVCSQKYVIYVDKEMYIVESSDGKDVIKPKNPAKDYPEVSMTIQQIVDKRPADVAVEIEKELKAKFTDVRNEGEVTEPIKATLLRALSGNKWNDTVVQYYIIDNQKGGSFVIKQQYFMEAAEGHGARFYYMLKEFKITNED